MPEAFISLASMLLASPEPAPQLPAEPAIEDPPQAVFPLTNDELEDALRDARLFRAQLREALDIAVETLLVDVAAEVLGRELALAPVDIISIVDRIVCGFVGEDPVRVRLHPDDVHNIESSDIEVRGDAALRRGDAVLEVRCGEIDASLGARLDGVIRRRTQ